MSCSDVTISDLSGSLFQIAQLQDPIHGLQANTQDASISRCASFVLMVVWL